MKNINVACIIDDDPIFVLGTKRLMELSEFAGETMVFSNGELALNAMTNAIAQNRSLPDVIFLDINMPVMDGWDFLEEFEALSGTENVIIYVLSSSVDPADAERARSYPHVKDYITKPLNREKLKELSWR